jgi:DNA-directed RNA polymerase specialized sigma24 family protein
MEHSVSNWLVLLKSGNQDGARLLWDRYFSQVVQVAEQRTRGLLRRAADEEDVALSAFDSFCRAAARGEFERLENRDDLWQILLSLTIRKAIDLRRYDLAKRRSPDDLSLVPLDQLFVEDLISREPDPEFAAIVADDFQALLGRLKDDQMRVIAMRKLEGFTDAEIARDLGCSLRTIERRLDLIRRNWEA